MLREPQHERGHGSHPLGEMPFALSATAIAVVEGFQDFQLPFLG